MLVALPLDSTVILNGAKESLCASGLGEGIEFVRKRFFGGFCSGYFFFFCNLPYVILKSDS